MEAMHGERNVKVKRKWAYRFHVGYAGHMRCMGHMVLEEGIRGISHKGGGVGSTWEKDYIGGWTL